METEPKSAYNIFTAASYTVDKYDLSSLCTAKWDDDNTSKGNQ